MTLKPLLRPRALVPGDLVVIASLSGPLHAEYEPDLEQAVGVLERMGFRVRRAPLLEVGRRRWWSAARPEEIAEEFNGLLRDPEVRSPRSSTGCCATPRCGRSSRTTAGRRCSATST